MTSSTQNRTLEIEHSKTKQSRVLSRPNALLDAVTTHAGLDHTAPVAVRTEDACCTETGDPIPEMVRRRVTGGTAGRFKRPLAAETH